MAQVAPFANLLEWALERPFKWSWANTFLYQKKVALNNYLS